MLVKRVCLGALQEVDGLSICDHMNILAHHKHLQNGAELDFGALTIIRLGYPLYMTSCIYILISES